MRKIYLEFTYWLLGKEKINFQVKHVRITWLILIIIAVGVWVK